MTRACDRRPRTARAFMLIEALVGIVLLSMVVGFATAVLVRAHHRFREATRAADARAELARASRRMAADIRRAAGAAELDGGVALSYPDGSRVTWRLRPLDEGGRLVRGDARGEIVYRAALGDVQVSVEKRAGGSPYVAVVLELARPEGGEGTGRLGIIYVAACPRVRGAKP